MVTYGLNLSLNVLHLDCRIGTYRSLFSTTEMVTIMKFFVMAFREIVERVIFSIVLEEGSYWLKRKRQIKMKEKKKARMVTLETIYTIEA